MNGDETGPSRTEVKVGLFILAALAALAAVVILISQKRYVFEERVKIFAVFDDVGGLVEGAPVQLSGVNAGAVSRVNFERSTERPRVRVDMEITRKALDLVRADSVARVVPQGLLGDKLIDISLGTSSRPGIEPDGRVAAAPTADLTRMMAQTSEVLDRVRKIAEDASVVSGALAEPKTIADLQGIAAGVHRLLDTANRGPGLVHALFYDGRTASHMRDAVQELQRLTAHVDGAVRKIDRVLAATDDEGRQVINNLARAAKSVGDAAEEVRRSDVVGNLSRASADVEAMTRYMRSGRGTIGALIADPTVYEQLVTIFGGVQRSRLLRALVRYAISKDDAKAGRRVTPEPLGVDQAKR